MKSAFAPFDERLKIINTVIKPGFAAVRPGRAGERREGGRGGR